MARSLWQDPDLTQGSCSSVHHFGKETHDTCFAIGESARSFGDGFGAYMLS